MGKKKSIVVATVLALTLLIGGLLAYFTDTDTASNEFTLGGSVEISLSETNWDATNAQGIHPGATIQKNPVITNDSTSTPAYVFAEVIVPCYDSNADGNVDSPLFTLNSIGSGWNLMSTGTVNTTDKTITYVYNYGTSSTMTSLAASASTTSVFTSVTLETNLTAAQKATASATPTIVVNAHGIQTDSLSSSTPSGIYALINS